MSQWPNPWFRQEVRQRAEPYHRMNLVSEFVDPGMVEGRLMRDLTAAGRADSFAVNAMAALIGGCGGDAYDPCRLKRTGG